MSRPRRLPVGPPEINFVPMLDMVSLLIQLLMVNAQFGVYSEVNAALGAPTEDPQPGLGFAVRVGADGYDVSWTEGGSPRSEHYACAEPACASYDVARLAALARTLKEQHPSEGTVLVAPAAGVPFEDLVSTMDALRSGPPPERRPLFPDIVLGPGEP